ncbi:MAG: hypothetical protein KAJ22_00440 [Candidatus Izimaplasma sp.]|nr:hypothetical protein [Candidatus Izimaplasma bacterium]
MRKIENFVKHTFKDVSKEGKAELIKSVTVSLIEKVEDLIELGMTEKEAIDKAVTEFGTVEDFFQVPEELTRKEKRRKTMNHYKNDLLFSGVGSIIIISILLYTNLYFNPSILWFVIPSIAVLWWPLAILYNLLNKRENRKEENDE